MATGAVGHRGGAHSRRHPVIAGEIAGDTVAGDTELRRQLHAGVTGRAGIAYIAGSDRRLGIARRFDGVDAVAIGTHGRGPVAARNRLSVSALHEFLPDAVM